MLVFSNSMKLTSLALVHSSHTACRRHRQLHLIILTKYRRSFWSRGIAAVIPRGNAFEWIQ